MKRTRLKPGKGFQCSPAQREKVDGAACVVCGRDRYETPIDPAHVVPRSMAQDQDGDPLRVVPICRPHHRLYDTGALDLLPYLEPRWRDELAEAVRVVGLIACLERVTNERWASVADRAA